jgi:hypothetical protein
MVFNATFNNISVLSWRSVLLVEETGVPGENDRPVASHWQTWLPKIEQNSLSCVNYLKEINVCVLQARISYLICKDCKYCYLYFTIPYCNLQWFMLIMICIIVNRKVMWLSLSVTCDRSVVFSGYSNFLHQ